MDEADKQWVIAEITKLGFLPQKDRYVLTVRKVKMSVGFLLYKSVLQVRGRRDTTVHSSSPWMIVATAKALLRKLTAKKPTGVS